LRWLILILDIAVLLPGWLLLAVLDPMLAVAAGLPAGGLALLLRRRCWSDHRVTGRIAAMAVMPLLALLAVTLVVYGTDGALLGMLPALGLLAISEIIGRQGRRSFLCGFPLSMTIGLERKPATPKRRVLTFALDGNRVLPGFELPSGRQEPPATSLDAAAIKRGGQAYTRLCARCHGAGVVSDGSVPDLRKLDNSWYERFDAVVLDGLMLDMGMPRFDTVLTPRQSEEIKAYVLTHARDQWQLEQNQAWWLAFKTWLADKVAALLILFT